MFAIHLPSGVSLGCFFAVATATVTLVSGRCRRGGGGVSSGKPCSFRSFAGRITEVVLAVRILNPPGCGVGMNHYCEGLIYLMRSKKAKDKHVRKSLLGGARDLTLYTKRSVESAGGTCPIAAHVEGTMQDIELQFKIYGIK